MSVVLCVLGTVLILIAGSMVVSANASRGWDTWKLYGGVVFLCVLGTMLHRWSFMLERI